VKQPPVSIVRIPRSWAEDAHRIHTENKPWIQQKSVQGYGIGRKVKDGVPLDRHCVKVFVRQKRPKSKCKYPVPSTLRVKGIAEPIPTDVEAIGQVRLQMNTGRVRPVRPGFSISAEQMSPREAGTLGCLAIKSDGGGPYFLSAAHVLAVPDVGPVGGDVVQPGILDQFPSGSDFEVGSLFQWSSFEYEPSTNENTIDAAIARVANPNDVDSTIQGLGPLKGTSDQLEIGDQVRISGRTSGVNIGEVRALHCVSPEISIKRGDGSIGTVVFHDMVVCTPFSQDGDSGAIVMDDNSRAVGLLTMGSPAASWFCLIRYVLEAFDIELVSQ
jgi:hypothetical protein